jgi:hypothetical protein
MEILHGVLRSPAMAKHAFFYFRDPAYLDHLPKDANPADFRSENADHAERLRQLKARIRASGLPVRENYADPKALGQLVLADFTALIDRIYPEGSQPNPLNREAMDQDFYAASRERPTSAAKLISTRWTGTGPATGSSRWCLANREWASRRCRPTGRLTGGSRTRRAVTGSMRRGRLDRIPVADPFHRRRAKAVR